MTTRQRLWRQSINASSYAASHGAAQSSGTRSRAPLGATSGARNESKDLEALKFCRALLQDMAKSFSGNSSLAELYKLYMAAAHFDIADENHIVSKLDLRVHERMLRQHEEGQKARPM